jgi:MFS family permease
MGLSTLLRVFLPFAAGYFLSYLFRVVNAVLAPDLAADIGVGPSALGLLTSVYFITFASFQLPLGVLLDRYGPRKTEAVLLMFAAIGAFLFSQADSLAGLVIGRAFIGFGVSACLMASFSGGMAGLGHGLACRLLNADRSICFHRFAGTHGGTRKESHPVQRIAGRAN